MRPKIIKFHKKFKSVREKFKLRKNLSCIRKNLVVCEKKKTNSKFHKRLKYMMYLVNFPFLSSNVPSGPSYGVYISQLIRYARCCSHYDDFRYRHKCLVDRLLSQGYKALRLEKSFKKFYGRYQDLIEKYQRSVNAMVSDSFPGQFLFNM